LSLFDHTAQQPNREGRKKHILDVGIVVAARRSARVNHYRE